MPGSSRSSFARRPFWGWRWRRWLGESVPEGDAGADHAAYEIADLQGNVRKADLSSRDLVLTENPVYLRTGNRSVSGEKRYPLWDGSGIWYTMRAGEKGF